MNVCNLTEAAKTQITKLCKEHEVWGISLNVKGGGCAGFEYDWGTIAEPKNIEAGDEVIDIDGNSYLVIGSYSLLYLIGTEIDYVSSLVGSNFEIRNPNTKSSCGCGVSVNFNDDVIPHFLE